MDIEIDKKGGAIGFMDDFNAWVTRPSAKENITAIQQRILPRVEAWAKESRAIFEADKTGLIHFTSLAKARWDAVETAETSETSETAETAETAESAAPLRF